MLKHTQIFTAAFTLLLAPLATAAPPQTASISPKPGTTDVDPQTTAIVVTFDQDMGKGMSWTGGGPHYPTIDETQELGWVNSRTCVLPVKLESAKVYRLGLNSTSFQNFQNEAGEPLAPQTITFATKGASETELKRMQTPKIAKLNPPNGAKDVDPSITQVSVTFDQPMGGGMSWCDYGTNQLKSNGDVTWSADKRTCTMPVKLEPGQTYKTSINCENFQNFTNDLGIPAEPVMYEFTTAGTP